MKTLNDKKQELLSKLNTEIDIVSIVDLDNVTDFDSLYDEIDQAGGFDVDVIYYSTAMEYLSEHDNSLMESLSIASDMGFDVGSLSSETLASLLASQHAREQIQSLEGDINSLFEELEQYEDNYNNLIAEMDQPDPSISMDDIAEYKEDLLDHYGEDAVVVVTCVFNSGACGKVVAASDFNEAIEGYIDSADVPEGYREAEEETIRSNSILLENL